MLLKGTRIFIVEDNAFNHLVYQICFEGSGAIIDYDLHGRETLLFLKLRHFYDLIILDLALPLGKSGYDLFLEIRRLKDFKTTPIIAVSASEPAVAIPRLQDLGFSGFIPKPIYQDLFVTQIAQILAGEQLWITNSPHLPSS